MENIEQTQQYIDDAKSIVIIPSKVAGADSFCAGVGLYMMLKEKEKEVDLVYPGGAPEGFKDLIEDDQIVKNTSERELLVSIDYSDSPATRVNYNTVNDVLYLSISPVDKKFNINRVKTELRGFDYDLIITIGIQQPFGLGKTYNELEALFRNKPIINLDNTDKNSRFGKVNIVDPAADSLSLLVLNSAPYWDLHVNSKVAAALLKGISYRNLE